MDNLEVSVKIKKDSWLDCVDSARVTIWKDGLNKEPSESFKKTMIISEHSPFREVGFVIDISNLESWVATHIVRHHIGVEKYISTQRVDRKESSLKRADMPQGALVNMRISLNAQALINISKERLCHCASVETQMVWRAVVRGVGSIEPMIAQACVPKCIYRGFCPEGEKAKSNCLYSNKSLESMRVHYLERFCDKGCFING